MIEIWFLRGDDDDEKKVYHEFIWMNEEFGLKWFYEQRSKQQKKPISIILMCLQVHFIRMNELPMQHRDLHFNWEESTHHFIPHETWFLCSLSLW
jgi:hypothetical protein